MLFACIRVAAFIPSDGSCACVFFRRPRPRGTGVLPGWLQCGFHEGEVLHLSPLPHILSLSETTTEVSSAVRLPLEIYECSEDESTSPEEPLKWPITSEHNTPNTHLRTHSFPAL